MTEEKEQVEETEGGKIKISNEVVSIMAGVTATEVEGVAGMSSGIASGIAKMLGRKDLSRGVEVEVEDRKVKVDLYTIMERGARLHEVARKVQEQVAETIEENTGLEVIEVNVNVQGVNFETETEEQEAPVEETEGQQEA